MLDLIRALDSPYVICGLALTLVYVVIRLHRQSPSNGWRNRTERRYELIEWRLRRVETKLDLLLHERGISETSIFRPGAAAAGAGGMRPAGDNPGPD